MDLLTGVKNNENQNNMKEYLMQHTWFSPLTKGAGATTVGFALISTTDLDLFYKMMAGIIGALIMIFSFLNSYMDYKHKKRREKNEKEFGYNPDKSDKSDN